MGVQVQVISAVLGDISQLGLPALFGERYGSGWVLLRSQAFCSVPSGESPLAHHGLTICLNGGWRWVASKSTATQSSCKLVTGWGNQARPSCVLCVYRLGPQRAPSRREKPFVLGTLALGKGRGKIVIFSPLFFIFLRSVCFIH